MFHYTLNIIILLENIYMKIQIKIITVNASVMYGFEISFAHANTVIADMTSIFTHVIRIALGSQFDC